jgi:peptidoglycan hydrolase-like protein with peptidoglycan-binding domain
MQDHPPGARRKYSGKNPHNMHVHISVKRAKAHYDDDAAWALPGAAPPATPSAPPPPAGVEKRKTLRRRSKHAEDVRYLQKLLGITIDGVFGKETEEAVKRAQKENGLAADGIVGPYTWAALME